MPGDPRSRRLALGLASALVLLAVCPAVAGARSTRIEQTLQRISVDRIQRDLNALARINRFVLSPALPFATKLVEEELRGAGLVVELDPFTLSGTQVQVHNVIASIPGSLDHRPSILVSAHYDAIAFPEGDPAFGAEDNASGTAALLEVARVLAPEALATEVRFVAFAAEEVGLQGSFHFARRLKGEGEVDRVQAVLNMDMVGYDPDGARRVVLDGYKTGRALAARLADASTTYAQLQVAAGIFSQGKSDHHPLAELGIPALTIAGARWREYPFYHSARDLPPSSDPEMIAEVARAVTARVLMMAGFADGPPVARAGRFQQGAPGVTVRISGSGSFDPREQALTYHWSQLDGPAVTLDQTAAEPTLVPPAPGVYRFLLSVTTPDGRRSEPELGAAIVVEEGGCGIAARRDPSPPRRWRWTLISILILSVLFRPRSPR